MRFIALATLLSGCTTVMCPGGPAYPIEKSACAARRDDVHQQLTAHVTRVESGREEIPFVIAHTNASTSPLIITSYELTWPGGRKRVNGLALTVPSGATMERSLRVELTDGDLETLDASARVEPAY